MSGGTGPATGRYARVFKAAWAARNELAGPRRLAVEAAFLPAALSLQETPVHPAPRRFALAITAFFSLAVAWAVFGEVDIVAVAPGRIVVSERTKLVQPLENSVVKAVLVKDGDKVAAGQPLVELDTTVASADRHTVSEVLRASQSDVLRARAILAALERPGSVPQLELPADWTPAAQAAAQSQLEAEWSDITARTSRLASESARRQAEIATARQVVAKIESTLPLAQQREQDAKRLSEQGFMTSHLAQDRTRERIELERDLATQRARHAETQAALRESESTRLAYLAEVRRALRDREAQADLKRQQAEQEQAKVAHREKLTVLTAPVSGTVQQLAVHTVGGVVTEAQSLMVIVPDGARVTAEVVVENKDVGFVHDGQPVELKLETFPFTRYGTIPGRVTRVSGDAVTDEKRGAIYPATLALDRTTIDVDGKPIKLAPGMNVTAEIKTGRRRIIEFLLNPVLRAGSESMRER
jgi:hemolysin D